MATIRLICRAHTAAAAQQVYRLLFGTHTARTSQRVHIRRRDCISQHPERRGCDQIFMGDPAQQITRRERMHIYIHARSNFMPIMCARPPAASSACKSAATNVKCETHLLPSSALFLCDQHNSRWVTRHERQLLSFGAFERTFNDTMSKSTPGKLCAKIKIKLFATAAPE